MPGGSSPKEIGRFVRGLARHESAEEKRERTETNRESEQHAHDARREVAGIRHARPEQEIRNNAE